jgi:ubiquinol-cytochrome c reductase cytochrome c subunit
MTTIRLLLIVLGVTALTSARAAAQSAENGKALFQTYSCYACHGYAGHGSGNGPRLVPRRLPLPAFTAFVRRPLRMPPYSAKVLSDAQLADLWTYIGTLPPSPPAASIPLLKQLLTEK